MIARLRGQVLEIGLQGAVIDVGGVGYEVLLPQTVLVELPPVGMEVDLRVRQIVREDGWFLYGFSSEQGRRLFDLLLEVKACGPKIALSLLSELGEDGLAPAIAMQDTKALSRASGVGPKLAERIVLELREKVATEMTLSRVARKVAVERPPEDELVEALLALGYRRAEAEEAAASSRTSGGDVSEQLREALRRLNR